MPLLPNLLGNPKPQQPLLLLRSSAAQSLLPVLRQLLVSGPGHPVKTLLFCFLYTPSSLVNGDTEHLEIYDYLDYIPGYGDKSDTRQDILSIVREGRCAELQ